MRFIGAWIEGFWGWVLGESGCPKLVSEQYCTATFRAKLDLTLHFVRLSILSEPKWTTGLCSLYIFTVKTLAIKLTLKHYKQILLSTMPLNGSGRFLWHGKGRRPLV